MQKIILYAKKVRLDNLADNIRHYYLSTKRDAELCFCSDELSQLYTYVMGLSHNNDCLFIFDDCGEPNEVLAIAQKLRVILLNPNFIFFSSDITFIAKALNKNIIPANVFSWKFNQMDFNRTLNNLYMLYVKNQNKNKGMISIHANDEMYLLPFQKIIYVEEIDGYTEVVTENAKVVCDYEFSYFQKRLPEEFIRCQNEILVNSKKVSSFNYENNELFTKDGIRIAVSKEYSNMVNEMLNIETMRV